MSHGTWQISHVQQLVDQNSLRTSTIFYPKAIEKHAAQLCLLAEQPDYVKLVKALCADHNAPLVTVPSAKTLGEWARLCKIDSEGKARKLVGCSCVVIKDFGEESSGLNIVHEYVKSQ